MKGLYLGLFALSGACIAGALGWLLQRLLALTGVLDRFAETRVPLPCVPTAYHRTKEGLHEDVWVEH